MIAATALQDMQHNDVSTPGGGGLTKNKDDFTAARLAWDRARQNCESYAEMAKRLIDNQEKSADLIRRAQALKDNKRVSTEAEAVLKAIVESFWQAFKSTPRALMGFRREFVFLISEALPELDVAPLVSREAEIKARLSEAAELEGAGTIHIRKRLAYLARLFLTESAAMREALHSVRPDWNYAFFDNNDDDLSTLKDLLDSLEREFEARLAEKARGEQIGHAKKATNVSANTFTVVRGGVGQTGSLPAGSTSIPLRKRGRPHEWTKDSLERAVLEAAARAHILNKYHSPNLSQVAARLNTKRRPMNEEGLRKLMQRYGLKWSNLKRKMQFTNGNKSGT